MRLLEKLAIAVAVVLAAPLIAGAYGALHNQLSFTVSSEYFTAFKFEQFGLLSSPLPDRFRASIVGWRASWWLGPWLGVFLALALLLHRGPRTMWQAAWRSYVLMVVVTMLVGLSSLLLGVVQTRSLDLARYSGWFVPSALQHPRRFICAGYMHNGSYLGAAIAIVLAWTYNVYAYVRDRQDRGAA